MRNQPPYKKHTYLADFFSLFFPNLCVLCRNNQALSLQCFCLTCQQKLPYTNFHLSKDNTFLDRFWGRFPFRAGTALFFLFKNGVVEQLIYRLKYEDRPKVGIQLGRFYGQLLKDHPVFSTIEVIVPVPLHFTRLRKRGYNQSMQFALGLSATMNKPINNTSLKRILPTSTQTQKTRLERFENVLSAFQVIDPQILKNKHILLVDDVLTTGATLEACATSLLEIEGVQISMATIAIASA